MRSTNAVLTLVCRTLGAGPTQLLKFLLKWH